LEVMKDEVQKVVIAATSFWGVKGVVQEQKGISGLVGRGLADNG
jgi:peptide methionine sulfoxide reductase MsrA